MPSCPGPPGAPTISIKERQQHSSEAAS